MHYYIISHPRFNWRVLFLELLIKKSPCWRHPYHSAIQLSVRRTKWIISSGSTIPLNDSYEGNRIEWFSYIIRAKGVANLQNLNKYCSFCLESSYLLSCALWIVLCWEVLLRNVMPWRSCRYRLIMTIIWTRLEEAKSLWLAKWYY